MYIDIHMCIFVCIYAITLQIHIYRYVYLDLTMWSYSRSMLRGLPAPTLLLAAYALTRLRQKDRPHGSLRGYGSFHELGVLFWGPSMRRIPLFWVHIRCP